MKIRALNLTTGESWTVWNGPHSLLAKILERLRSKRGPWKSNPVVHAIVR